jgi:hypothetical protein
LPSIGTSPSALSIDNNPRLLDFAVLSFLSLPRPIGIIRLELEMHASQ